MSKLLGLAVLVLVLGIADVADARARRRPLRNGFRAVVTAPFRFVRRVRGRVQHRRVARHDGYTVNESVIAPTPKCEGGVCPLR